MKFKVGDRVIIKPDGRFRNGMFRENPYGISGTIYTIAFNSFIYVKWDNGEYNSYDESDLELEQKYLQQQEAKKLLGLK